MQVALDGANDDLANRLDIGGGQERAQDRQPAFHRPGGDEHFGDIKFAVLEHPADLAHGGDQAFLEDCFGRDIFRQGLVDLFLGGIQIAFDHTLA